MTATKLSNQREGWTRAEDTLPKRFLSEGLTAGPDTSALLPRDCLEAMIQAAYSRAQGWDADGRVPADRLDDLGPG